MTIVADASALLEFLLSTERGARVRNFVHDPDADLHVPALCDIEVLSGLRRSLLHALITPARAAEAAQDYVDLRLTRHGHLSLMGRILALRDNFSAYDATYVALAERLEAPLLTADKPLAEAAAAHTNLILAP